MPYLDIKVHTSEDVKEKIEKQWESNHRLIERVLEHQKYEDIESLKAEVMRDLNFIVCHVNRGEQL